MNELEDEFKLITLSNDNDSDFYFKVLSALADDKKEQQRLRSIIDKACIDYIKDNEYLKNKVLNSTYNRKNIIDILNENAHKELIAAIIKLGTNIHNNMRAHGIKKMTEILNLRGESEILKEIVSLESDIDTIINENQLFVFISESNPHAKIDGQYVGLHFKPEFTAYLSGIIAPRLHTNGDDLIVKFMKVLSQNE
jgi:hypothetical protein